MTSLNQKVAVITGASRGIGAGIAKRLASEGAEVILHYSSGEKEVHQVADAIKANGGVASLVQADLSTPDGATALASRIKSKTVDILVNNAGIAPFASIEQTDEATFDRLANVNMRSVFFVTQKLLPRIPNGGRIINVSSAVTRVSFSGVPAYSATKGFINVLTLHLAAELGPRAITVNAVAPGIIETQMSAPILQSPGGMESLAQMQVMPGVGKPDYVAGVVAFLAGPDGAWTTGQVIDVSGGTKI